MIYKFKVEDPSLNLAPFLKGALGEKFSAKLIKKTIEKGACRVNGRVVSYSNHKLKAKDIIEIAVVLAETIKPSVVFEDEHFLVIDKPSGVESHEATLQKLFNKKFSLVHRLDKETSGLLILAKDGDCKKKFEDLFREKSLIKRYLGIVDGLVLEEKGMIDYPLEELKKGHHAVYVQRSAQGQEGVTLWKKLSVGQGASFLEFEIITGKTHQIRAHAMMMHHPILGDPVYAKKPVCKLIAERLMLHAYYLEFIHPVLGTKMKLFAPLPKLFQDYLKRLMPDASTPRY